MYTASAKPRRSQSREEQKTKPNQTKHSPYARLGLCFGGRIQGFRVCDLQVRSSQKQGYCFLQAAGFSPERLESCQSWCCRDIRTRNGIERRPVQVIPLRSVDLLPIGSKMASRKATPQFYTGACKWHQLAQSNPTRPSELTWHGHPPKRARRC